MWHDENTKWSTFKQKLTVRSATKDWFWNNFCLLNCIKWIRIELSQLNCAEYWDNFSNKYNDKLISRVLWSLMMMPWKLINNNQLLITKDWWSTVSSTLSGKIKNSFVSALYCLWSSQHWNIFSIYSIKCFFRFVFIAKNI